MSQAVIHGHIVHDELDRRDDYLFRLSLKSFIRNERGEVLVVKETGRTWWDLPGGGMDHEEDLKRAIARETSEEVNLRGDFTFRVISVDEPKILDSNIWQVRLIFEVTPEDMTFSPGPDADEIAFMHPDKFKNSEVKAEQRIYRYARLASQHTNA